MLCESPAFDDDYMKAAEGEMEYLRHRLALDTQTNVSVRDSHCIHDLFIASQLIFLLSVT